MTVTVNVQELVFSALSVATQTTAFVPTAKVEPLAGVQVTVTLVQLSPAVTIHVTLLLLHWPGSAATTIGAGQVIDGASVSLTVTAKLHALVFSLESVAMHVTDVVPTGKELPEAGVQATVVLVQLSVAVGAKFTTAEHAPRSLVVMMSAGHAMAGGVESIIVTVKEQVAELVHSLVALHVTVVVPSGNVDPDAGSQTTVIVPGQHAELVVGE